MESFLSFFLSKMWGFFVILSMKSYPVSSFLSFFPNVFFFIVLCFTIYLLLGIMKHTVVPTSHLGSWGKSITWGKPKQPRLTDSLHLGLWSVLSWFCVCNTVRVRGRFSAYERSDQDYIWRRLWLFAVECLCALAHRFTDLGSALSRWSVSSCTSVTSLLFCENDFAYISLRSSLQFSNLVNILRVGSLDHMLFFVILRESWFALNLMSSCFNVLSAGITGLCHHGYPHPP